MRSYSLIYVSSTVSNVKHKHCSQQCRLFSFKLPELELPERTMRTFAQLEKTHFSPWLTRQM